MQDLQAFLSTQEFLIGLAVIVTLIILLLLFRFIRKRQLLKKLNQLEIQVNAMRSTPLQYKLNKAVSLVKVNQNVEGDVEDIQTDFSELMNAYDRITFLLGESEDALLGGKLGVGKQHLNDLQAICDNTQGQLNTLSTHLDRLLEDETRLRDAITGQKNVYREYKVNYQQHMSNYGDSGEALENLMEDIEQQFNTFEEWMFASEYDKAQEENNRIVSSVESYGKAIELIPNLLEKAKGVVPHLIDDVSKSYQAVSSKGVFLQHLEVSKNLSLISDSLKEDLTNIRQLRLEEVDQRLETSQTRLKQLATSIDKESRAFDTVIGLSASSFTQLDQVGEAITNLETQIPELKERFGFDELEDQFEKMSSKFHQYLDTKHKLQNKLTEEQFPSSSLQIELNEFSQEVNLLESEIQEANRSISNARSDEQRAQKQLLKLHLIMNDISTKIESRHLPHIAQTYDADVSKAKTMIDDIQNALNMTPLPIDTLNQSVNDSIDFIYRLYNNVNNLVGTVDMVENAIVYANKYRSMYPELDSELTRGEISFRNGEYTYALKTVIVAIEKIKPGSPYEQLIMDNSRSA